MIRSSKIFVFFLILVLAVSANAQYKKPVRLNDPDYDVGKRLRFGFSLGFNVMDFTVKNSGRDSLFADVTNTIPGFNVNAIADFRLTENFHLRFLPGYAFSQRDICIYDKKNKFEYKLKIESSFIDLPVSIKYSAQRVSNFRPYLLVGGNFRLDLASSKKVDIDLNPDPDVDSKDWFRLVRGDAYYEFGFGTDFFLEYFKFSIEFKYSAGIFNVLSNEYSQGAERYVKAMKQMNSQLFIVAFHFE